MEIIKYYYLYSISIIVQIITLICTIFIIFQFLDIKLHFEDYFNLKKTLYNSDIESYKQKVVELLEEKDILLQQNNSLIEELNNITKELENLEKTYNDMELENEIIINNYVACKKKIL